MQISGNGSITTSGASITNTYSGAADRLYAVNLNLNVGDVVSINMSVNVGQNGLVYANINDGGIQFSQSFFHSTTTGSYGAQTYYATVNSDMISRFDLYVQSGTVTNYNYSSAYVNWIQVNGIQVFP